MNNWALVWFAWHIFVMGAALAAHGRDKKPGKVNSCLALVIGLVELYVVYKAVN
ncbi:hypothetical protein [Rhizobium phage RHph_I40]|uniref:Uncharacterized protein n=1 Tax=Rhizobium phage RHph_I38 TaxID=2509734 RepID=A0A7S5R8R5_9CAUD|nr:hypothetical protein EVC01_008 [Rhizobium phage RHph_I38]QXV73637.1 hypothetical protein [Rhizobium phage RHph_I40]